MEKYYKKLKKYYKSQHKKQATKKNKFFDSLLKRIFISSLILLTVVLINNVTDFQFSFLNKQFNFTKIGIDMISVFNDHKNIEQVLNTTCDYEKSNYNGTVNIFSSNSTNSVKALKSGVVTKISKENELYTITIQTYENYYYEYSDLVEIDCYLYQYITIDKIIGLANNINEKYTFSLKIYDERGNYEY